MTTPLPKRLESYFNDYASFHRTPGNKVCHYLGIPMITATLLGLLASLVIAGGSDSLIRLDGGVLLLIAATLWYLILDWRLAVPFALVAAGFYFVGRAIPTPWLWALFILGWVFQFIGHYAYEKKSPAFFKNIEHILIGPLWVFANLVGYGRSDIPNSKQK